MTEVNSELNFAALLTENRRIDDDFVNATEWCKQFGKDFSYFWKSPEIRAFAKALEKKIKTSQSAELASGKGLAYERPGRGKKGDTWIHPLLAIKLAEWLSPEFDVLVKETFKSFIESPEDFAADILINSHNKDRVERAKKRVLVQKKARLEVSGIGNGTEKDIRSRVNTKLKQITPSDGSLPGYVSIVEFSAPCSRVVKKCKK